MTENSWSPWLAPSTAPAAVHCSRPARLDLTRVQPEFILDPHQAGRERRARAASHAARQWELDQYDDAELPREKFAAMMMGFLTRQNPGDAFFPNAAPQETPDAGGVAVAQLEAGTLTGLEPGEDVKFSEPAGVGGNYEAFERIQLLRIAAGLGLP